MKPKGIKTALLLLFLIIIPLYPCITASAAKDGSTHKPSSLPDSRIICIASNGGRCEFPEGSLEAVLWGEQFGYVSVDVRLTKDGIPVISADDTASRMFCNEDGSSADFKISETGYDVIKELYLRNGSGTDTVSRSQYHPCELSECIMQTEKGKTLFVRTCAGEFKAVYEYLEKYDLTDDVCFRFRKESTKKILKISEGTDAVVCGNYQGNIIFLATGNSKKSFEHNLPLTELGSTNGHGVLYDNFLMKRFKTNRIALVSMTGGRCGKRADNEAGWDDLIKRGYKAIETNYPDRLRDYIDRADDEKAMLEKKYSGYKDADLSFCSTDTEVPFRDALKKSKKILAGVSALSEYENAVYELDNTYNRLTPGIKKATALKIDVTPGRLTAAFLCGAAILISQILLYKQRKK